MNKNVIVKLNENQLCNVIKNVVEKMVTEQKKFIEKHHDPQNANEDVMKRYWNIDNQSAPVLVEKITIDRLMQKHGDNGFVIISANRSDKPEERNIKATQNLIQDLKNSNFSYLPTYGGYHGTDNVVDVFEPNFTVFNYSQNGNPTNWEDLHKFALDMCAKYEQDSVYINEPGKAPEYQNANGDKINRTSTKKYIKNDLNQEYFTSLSSPEEIAAHGKTQKIGRRFTSDIQFENKVYVNPIPSSHTARRRRSGEIILNGENLL